jgi:hypothetical protein
MDTSPAFLIQKIQFLFLVSAPLPAMQPNSRCWESKQNLFSADQLKRFSQQGE